MNPKIIKEEQAGLLLFFNYESINIMHIWFYQI